MLILFELSDAEELLFFAFLSKKHIQYFYKFIKPYIIKRSVIQILRCNTY